MGGNALKYLNPLRVDSTQAVALFHHIQRNLAVHVAAPLWLVPWLWEKQDHGDLDIVIEHPHHDLHQRLLPQLFGIDPARCMVNDTVVSTPMPALWAPDRVVQVDFIAASSDDARTKRLYYGGGDLGMLLGRVAAWHGFVFGMDGLRLRSDPALPWSRDIRLSTDPSAILRFLGYPPRFPPFTTYPELWRHVVEGPRARPWMFLPSATTAENRSRDRQRRQIGRFTEWVLTTYPKADQAHDPLGQRATPAQALAEAETAFPDLDLRQQVAAQQADWQARREDQAALGRAAIRAVLADPDGLAAERLGELIRAVHSHLPRRDERERLLDQPDTRELLLRLARTAARCVVLEAGLAVNRDTGDEG